MTDGQFDVAQDIQFEAGPVAVDVDSRNHWIDVGTVAGLLILVALLYVFVRKATK